MWRRRLCSANNYAVSLQTLKRSGEAKSLLRRTIPVARRVLGDNHKLTLKMRWLYAESLYKDDGATLGDLRESVAALEELKRISRRVLGGAHPTTRAHEYDLRRARAALHACEE